MREKILVSFFEKLDIQREYLVQNESPDRVYVRQTTTAKRVLDLTVSEIEQIIRLFGDAIRVEIGLEGIQSEVTIHSENSAEGIAAQIRSSFQNNPDDRLQVVLTLTKSRIIESLRVPREFTFSIYYLFWENLQRYLTEDNTLTVSEQLFPTSDTMALIVLAERELEFIGKRIAVIHEENASNPLLLEITNQQNVVKQIEKLKALAQNSGRQIGFRLPDATPLHYTLHLDVTSENYRAEIADIFYVHLINLALLYFANVSILSDEALDITYATASGDQITRIQLSSSYSFDLRTYVAINNLLNWLTEESSEEKLSYFQTVVAKDLDETAAVQTFLENLETLLKDAKQYYSISIGPKVSKNFDSIQAITRYVAQTNSDIGNAIDSMTKNLNDTLIAAVGVIILSLIASLTDGGTTEFIFTTLMFAYAGYILVFQIIFRMITSWTSYTILSQSGDIQVRDYRSKIGQERFNELKKSLQSRKRQFKITFGFTLIVLILLFFFVVSAGIWGPQQLVNWGVISSNDNNPAVVSTPTPITETPTLTPSATTTRTATTTP